MSKPLKHNFTPDVLKTLDKKKVETILENAQRLGAEDLIAMCELDLAERKPAVGSRSTASRSTSGTRARIASAKSVSRENMFANGYHFVCENDAGVIDLGDGRFWSPAAVIAEADPDASLNGGAYLALHEAKTRPSYRQGKIIGFRKVADGAVEAVEFLVKAEPKSRAWVGAGAGETGYKWAKVRDED